MAEGIRHGYDPDFQIEKHCLSPVRQLGGVGEKQTQEQNTASLNYLAFLEKESRYACAVRGPVGDETIIVTEMGLSFPIRHCS